MNEIKYRPEIDGLRALAVVGVLLYHAEFSLFGYDIAKGGYLGVDAFFVISGYLITLIILSELKSAGDFNVFHFYGRRIRRIIPVLLLVMSASVPAAWYFLLPAELMEYSKSILYSLGFLSNFFFFFTTTSYGAEPSLLKPFLHTWSLSVEEQFYLIFPVLLLILYRASARFLGRGLVAIPLCSFLLATGLSFYQPEFNFYFPLSRVWELGAGALLAYHQLFFGGRKRTRFGHLLATTGLCALIASMAIFSEATRHPGLLTLIPVIASCLLVYFASPSNFTGSILSNPWLVKTGLISYSLYLWHFPVFAFGRMHQEVPGNYDKLLWIALSIVLSLLSYHFVEKPFRNPIRISKSALAITIGAVMIITISLHMLSIYSLGFPGRFERASLKAKTASNDYAEITNSTPVFPKYKRKPWNYLTKDGSDCNYNAICIFPADVQKAEKLAFVGDSHLAALSKDLRSRFSNYHQMFSLTGGCPFFLGASRIDPNGRKHRCTSEVQQKRLESIQEYNSDIVLLFARYPLAMTGRWYDNGEGGIEVAEDNHITITDGISKGVEITPYAVTKAVTALLETSSDIILIYPYPEAGWHVPRSMARYRRSSAESAGGVIDLATLSTSYEAYMKRTDSTFQLFDSFKSARIHRVYPHTLFCNADVAGRCVTHDGSSLYYADTHHPSYEAATIIGELIEEKVNDVISKRKASMDGQGAIREQ